VAEIVEQIFFMTARFKENAMTRESLKLRGLESVHWYVHDLERTRRFYTELLDFAEVGASDDDVTARGKQKSVLFQAGDIRLLCSQPVGEGGRAWRWLQKHPEGVGTVVFSVADIEHTWRVLEARGGTMIDEIRRAKDAHGTLAWFSITTPFGNTTFRFVERNGYRPLFPGFVAYDAPRGGQNRFGLKHVDHITSNFRTLKPMELWMKEVMGFAEFWNIEFHTADDIAHGAQHGSGLKSIVLWDPESGVKFANNEPNRPNFKQSQINIFVEDHRDNGIQHLALAIDDIVSNVRAMKARPGIEFLTTPAAYYDYMPERLARTTVGTIDENIQDLRDLGILVDGNKPHSYLLQIFMKEAGHLLKDKEAGPFFYEIIERKGDRGFGGGNFRALFESIERAQREAASGATSAG
jgi:4-hydroxyphenylpyruvate dioxygenase